MEKHTNSRNSFKNNLNIKENLIQDYNSSKDDYLNVKLSKDVEDSCSVSTNTSIRSRTVSSNSIEEESEEHFRSIPLINNQLTNLENKLNKVKKDNLMLLKNEPVVIPCQHCNQMMLTKIVKNLNGKTTLFCMFTLPLLFIPFSISQVLKGKVLSIYDISHFCTRCNGFIGVYSSL